MEPPFMKGYWNNPENMLPRGTRRSWHEKNLPRSRPSIVPAVDGRDNPSKSRVNIPVEFVDGSSASKPRFQTKKRKNYKWRAKLSKTAAAVKMQTAYRGFRVRKSMPLKNLKAIAQAKESMEELQRQIGDENAVELIRQNEKERLRITEGLMSLLLKLDAIQGVDTIVRESRKAVIRELIKLQETVDAINAEKTLESKPPTKKAEESVLPNKESSPVVHVPMDIQASESNATSSSNSELTSLETALAKKVILGEKDHENNKDFPVEKKTEPSPESKNPEEKEEMVSINETMDSSGTANGSSQPSKESPELLKHSLEPVKDSSEPETFSNDGDVNDNDDVSIVDKEQISSDMPRIETNESGSMEEDFRCAYRKAIFQEAFEMLDQIKSRIAEGQGQKYNKAPLQANDVANIVQKNEEKLKEVISEHSIQSMERSEEHHEGEDTSNQGKLSQQDGIPEAKTSVQANNSEEASCVEKREGTNKDMESFSQRRKDDDNDNESKGESTIMAVENVWEENKKLNKVIEDLHQRNQVQSDIIGHVSKKLEQLEKRMLQLNNREKSTGKRKRN